MQGTLKNRKGMGSLIAALVVMTLSIGLALGLGYTLTRTIDFSLSPGVSCTPLQIAPPLQIESITAESTGTHITLSRPFDTSAFSSFSLIFTPQSGISTTWTCAPGCVDCALLNAGETKTYSLEEPLSPGTQVVLKVDECAVGSSIID